MTSQIAEGLPGLARSSVAWVDYDNDGRMSLANGREAESWGSVGEHRRVWSVRRCARPNPLFDFALVAQVPSLDGRELRGLKPARSRKAGADTNGTNFHE